jgi:hypothetical protein
MDLFLRFGRVKLPEARPIAAIVSPHAFCFIEAYRNAEGRRTVQVSYGWNGWYRMQDICTLQGYKALRDAAEFVFYAVEAQAARDIRRALELEKEEQR